MTEDLVARGTAQSGLKLIEDAILSLMDKEPAGAGQRRNSRNAGFGVIFQGRPEKPADPLGAGRPAGKGPGSAG